MGGLLIFAALFALVIGSQLFLLLILKWYMPWFEAVRLGVPLTMVRLTLWRMTGVPAPLLVDTYLLLQQEGPPTSLADIESVYRTRTDQVDSPNLLAALVRHDLHGQEFPDG